MIKLNTVLPNPNNPRTVNDDKFKKLVQSIKDFPKMLELRPIVVDENNIALGGNMRLKALKKLGYKEIPESWIKRASELTDDEKRQFIIKDNVGFGEWEWDLLRADWDIDELGEWGLDLPEPIQEETEKDNEYTNKIETPVYEASGEKPDTTDLVDRVKAEALIDKIEKADLADLDKDFLKLAAFRHLVFDYSKIADFYANSTKEVQELMEESALVIIDFDKAIECGYTALSEDIANQYKNHYD